MNELMASWEDDLDGMLMEGYEDKTELLAGETERHRVNNVAICGARTDSVKGTLMITNYRLLWVGTPLPLVACGKGDSGVSAGSCVCGPVLHADQVFIMVAKALLQEVNAIPHSAPTSCLVNAMISSTEVLVEMG